MKKIDITSYLCTYNTVIKNPNKKPIILPIEEIFPDPKDIIFYAVTMAAKKNYDPYLVTGNIKHFPVKSFVVTPREMLTILDLNPWD